MTNSRAFAMAVAHHRAGRLQEAVAAYQASLAIAPGDADAFGNLGLALQGLGRRQEAVAAYRRASELRPNFSGALNNLGIVLLELEQFLDAEHSLRASIQADPENSGAHANLALALRGQARLDEAASSCKRAIDIRPSFAEAHLNLGTILRDLGRLKEAEASCRNAILIRPKFVEAFLGLGNVLRDLGQLQESEAAYRQAIGLRHDYADAYVNLGNVLRDIGRLADSEASHRRAIEIQPKLAEAHIALAITLRETGKLDAAEAQCKIALELRRGDATVYLVLGHVLRELGRIDEALENFERAIVIAPQMASAHRGLLMSLPYSPAIDPDTSFNLHRRFELARDGKFIEDSSIYRNDISPKRKLRIGYFSSDFRSHSAAVNLLPLFRAHDRSKFEIYLYSEVVIPDSITLAFQEVADKWRSTIGLSDAEVGALARSDRVDIFIVLAARFDRNRPLVCAHAPAPVRISSHDVATSGLTCIDYIFSDRMLTPRKSPERFTERVLCVPSFYLAEPPSNVPKIKSRSGSIVFGSFNNPAKVSDLTLSYWARILKGAPDCKLHLRYRNFFDSVSIRERVYKIFEQHGASPEQVVFPPAAGSHFDHLDGYNSIDIALDTFPFSGSTTTFDALIMGVPVVTYPGWSMVSRWSSAILNEIGLSDLIASSPAQYLDISWKLASDREMLSSLRSGLRDRVVRSNLCNATRKARQFERLYRTVWRRWCAFLGKMT